MEQFATTPTKFRANLFHLLEDVADNSKELTITLKTGRNAVVISEEMLNHFHQLEVEKEYWKQLRQLENDLRQGMKDVEEENYVDIDDLDWGTGPRT
ncbi:type II toxin-antitoxin system Phd/YefM family antitoxin [Lactococcus termiticola]|uniref:Antitoxin n=1 Tax=Lactococcus termiticola TaxID=2169526 RepID=A0A2R5HF14_9LACT|nr:type II toxin-antitoxin system Phd/YefM family antitoxin [Lactococcus termiticola]GBG96622.1 hypothetical protein NtB2_00746 [Lactococcus termiticola]